jgi:asparagine synthase (glutamine-hydrolysing)
MSMANSLEVRPPFLDHLIVESLFKMPPEVKLHGGISKYILKKSMENSLPSSILHREKHGFMAPIGNWLRKDAKDYMESVLFSTKAKSRGYFNYEYIASLWNQHLSGKHFLIDISLHLWALLIFELWHRQFIDSSEYITVRL